MAIAINIKPDGTIRDALPTTRSQKTHVNKTDKNKVFWHSIGPYAWVIRFKDRDSPLVEGSEVRVPDSGKSQTCTVSTQADERPHQYEVIGVDTEHEGAEPEEAGPEIIVESGDGGIPPGHTERKRSRTKAAPGRRPPRKTIPGAAKKAVSTKTKTLGATRRTADAAKKLKTAGIRKTSAARKKIAARRTKTPATAAARKRAAKKR